MRRRTSMRGGSQTANADQWYGTSWCCECGYTNVGSDRCYFCGSRAPRDLADKVAGGVMATPQPVAAPVGDG